MLKTLNIFPGKPAGATSGRRAERQLHADERRE
jgi:hypothetical protein